MSKNTQGDQDRKKNKNNPSEPDPEEMTPAAAAENDEAADGAENEEEDKDQPVEEQDEDLNNKYMRLAADFQNYRRRVEKEKSDIYAYANEKIAVDLLDVMDNFERALQHNQEGAEESFAQGMDLIFKQLQDLLKKNSVEEMRCLGEEFDPNVHHAVLMEENEAYDSGKVCEVLKKGYTLQDKVIRPAMVKVSQ